jgi:hypothetical protein
VAREDGDTLWSTRVSTTDNCITNGLEIKEGYTGSVMLLAANNDERVRLLDIERREPVCSLELEWAANAATMNPRNRCGAPLSWPSLKVMSTYPTSGDMSSALFGAPAQRTDSQFEGRKSPGPG